jgi:hypothetical protein
MTTKSRPKIDTIHDPPQLSEDRNVNFVGDFLKEIKLWI